MRRWIFSLVGLLAISGCDQPAPPSSAVPPAQMVAKLTIGWRDGIYKFTDSDNDIYIVIAGSRANIAVVKKTPQRAEGEH
jgi:hypothetical protein